ncbi:molybdenum cofactor cytidylyltransferase [Sporosalibacterium faouarense]|uniref:molybdenum cofactor cytidylyltransferase n=1 Tax=Sporosalibacterium faouarense TaxID=516123 RepID=UPI00141D114C|nr:molybdenum cofactor cytidylyltransferase [Sporosalibacterium faouarense]MTI48631.1 molybdenum cofactor cytidylyltransferase [Bacillota bacterium]
MITGIILASGFSRRMDKEKLLLGINGVPILEHVLKSIISSKIDEVILIYRKNEIKDIGKKYGITTIYNGFAEKGQSESIKLGIFSAKEETDGFMFFVGDQPYLNTETVNNLINMFNSRKYEIVVPSYNGKRGTPTIFSSIFKEELLNIEGDKGGRNIIKRNLDKVGVLNIDEELIGMDIDTIEEYISLTKWS